MARLLTIRSQGEDVSELTQRLVDHGYLTITDSYLATAYVLARQSGVSLFTPYVGLMTPLSLDLAQQKVTCIATLSRIDSCKPETAFFSWE
jgi:hypothetical protein